MKPRRILCAVLAAIMTVAVLVSCKTDLSSSEEESRTVMTVDEWEVPYEMYRYAVGMHLRDQADIILANAGKATSADGEKDADEIIAEALELLDESEKEKLAADVEQYSVDLIVNTYSIFTAAKNEEIDPFGERINTLTDMKMEEIRAGYKNDKEYLETIKLRFMTDNVYSILTRYEILFEELYEKYVKDEKIDVSDEAVIEHMMSEDGIRVKQILITFEHYGKDEAKYVSELVSATLAENTDENGIVDEAVFDELTDKYGKDLHMFNNRDGYYICRGYSDKTIEEVSFSLGIGEVSDIISSVNGYRILMRARKDRTFVETKVSTLKDICLGGIYRTMLDEYSINADVSKNEEFEKIDVFAMN